MVHNYAFPDLPSALLKVYTNQIHDPESVFDTQVQRMPFSGDINGAADRAAADPLWLSSVF